MPKDTLLTIQLPAALKERLQHGHPWVYRTHVPPGLRMVSGTWVRVRCAGWSGYALWDADGPIALRVFSERQIPDSTWLHARVAAAWQLRVPLREAGCTAYRWLYGEGDGLPGLTVDRYADYAVLQTYSAGAASLRKPLLAAMQQVDPTLRGVVIRGHAGDADDDDPGLHETWRDPPPRDLAVSEYGIRMYADLQGGQKTGLFLDQRENRRFVEGLSAGRSVLNCFAYTGGFSLYALRGGARAVVSADIGKGLAAATTANLALNGMDQARHRYETADCFDLLSAYAEQGRRFEVVILDPPSFARRKESRYAALRAYTRLNTLGLRCVAPGGLLVSASCTSQVSLDAFHDVLGRAAEAASCRLQIIHEAGQPPDHPVPAHFPEGRYLKFVVARVGEIV